ncbi:hypothetical protein ABPG72_002426 [Tetrahymena utriculariae]
MSTLINISFFFVILKLIQSLDYIKSPQVEINQLNPVQYTASSILNNGNQQKIISQTFQTEFTETPQVLISINCLDIQANGLQNINFQINQLQINQTQFNAIIQKSGNQQIYSLYIQYLAINNKNTYVKNGNFQFSNQIYNQDSQWVYAKQQFNYSRNNLAFNIWNVSISVYIIGIDKSVQQQQNAYLSIVSEVNYNSNNFDIIFKTRDLNSQNKINAIYYNYIEIYQQKSNSYYNMQTIIEQSINPANSTNPILKNQDYRTSITPYYGVQIDNIAGIFYGFSGFELSLDYVFRLEIAGAQIAYDSVQQKNNFKFQYNTWSDTQIIAAQSQILIFAQINCNKNNTYFLDDQSSCTENCPTIGYFSGQISDAIEGSLKYCIQCDKSCQTCDGGTSQNCLSCKNSGYLFQKQCFQTQPINSFCDSSTFICYKCTKLLNDNTNPMCKYCDQSLNSCISCLDSNQYLFQGICFQIQPNNTYCEQTTKICQECLQQCSSCLNNISCETCSIQYPYLFQSQCLKQQPDKTFCDSSNKCQICPNNCKSCDQNLSCLECISKDYFLYNSQCFEQKPPNVFCDKYNICKDCNKTCNGCHQSDSSDDCIDCNQLFPYLLNYICFQSQPSQTYCYQNSQTYICMKCLNNAQTNQCFQIQPAKTFCDQNRICKSCYQNCQTCQGATEKDCLSCYPQFILHQNQCLCSDNSEFYNNQTNKCEMKKLSLFSQSTKQTIQGSAENVNQVSIGMSFTFAITQGLTNSGSSLLSQMLTIQKIFYMQLVNIGHPNFLYDFMKTLSSNGITQKLEITNIFQNYFQIESQYYNQTLEFKFAYNNISSCIIKNTGGNNDTLTSQLDLSHDVILNNPNEQHRTPPLLEISILKTQN